ncbi:hypothetical protein PPERSA_01401 [Pseudocohnilembus persalinus]|uniref:Trimethylguanosine synthase n=1 Tax=Pseudocohnilembus persalinus TaxID=266149 RepID=A0A0V0QH68_PSEPJ|nr:hypothetical protein PPERSA_01401 [Pseudocohnilembus persalinus]|eukprot:KRX01498.1 hypothetical protein PPERSA_01401 [Pseudocohnilembus persalinus]
MTSNQKDLEKQLISENNYQQKKQQKSISLFECLCPCLIKQDTKKGKTFTNDQKGENEAKISFQTLPNSQKNSAQLGKGLENQPIAEKNEEYLEDGENQTTNQKNQNNQENQKIDSNQYLYDQSESQSSEAKIQEELMDHFDTDNNSSAQISGYKNNNQINNNINIRNFEVGSEFQNKSQQNQKKQLKRRKFLGQTIIGEDKFNEDNEEYNGRNNSDPNNQGLMQNFMGSLAQSKRALRLKAKWSLQDLPKNEIFLLYDHGEKDFIMAKITQKKFRQQKSIDLTGQDLMNSQSFTTSSFIPDIEENSKVNDKIAHYIAKRLKNYSLVFDPCCGVGGVAIHLAKQCDFVIAGDFNQAKINLAKENFKRAGVINKVELLFTDIFDIKNESNLRSIDAIFVHPTFEKDSVDLLNGVTPNLTKLLDHCFKLSKNLILLLPADSDIKYELESTFTIEIEEIRLNKKIKNYIVWVGDCAQIQENEEIQFLVQKLTKSSGRNIVDEKWEHFLNHLKTKIGLRGILKYLNQSQIRQKGSNQNQSLMQIFLDILVEKKKVSRNEIFEHMNQQFVKSGSFDLNFQKQLSQEFSLQNSRDSNDFQLALSDYKNEEQNEENQSNSNKQIKNKNAEQSALRNQSTFKYQNSNQSDGIIQGSKISDFEVTESEEEDDDDEYDDEDEENRKNKEENQSESNVSDLQRIKAKSQDFAIFKPLKPRGQDYI